MRLFDETKIEIAHRIKESTDSLAKLLETELRRAKECKVCQVSWEDRQNTHPQFVTN